MTGLLLTCNRWLFFFKVQPITAGRDNLIGRFDPPDCSAVVAPILQTKKR
jgi:hypothetical protein